MEERFDEIVAFAELERFIDAPVKTYSSGMYVRLGFAVAIHVDPDVLLIDEVLAVGDEAFTRKCLDKIGEFRRRGKTIVLVTHSLGLVEKMCDDVLWLRQGEGRRPGRPQAGGRRLPDLRGGRRGGAARPRARPGARRPPPAAAPEAPGEDAGHGYREGRWGSREVEITAVRLLDDRGRERHVYVPGRAPHHRARRARAREPVEDFVFGIGLFTADGVSVYGTNTHLEDFVARAPRTAPARSGCALDDLRLVEGTYLLDVAAHRRDGTPYDYHRGLYSFRVKSRIKDVGVYRPAHRWDVRGRRAPSTPPPPRPELDLHDDGRPAGRGILERARAPPRTPRCPAGTLDDARPSARAGARRAGASSSPTAASTCCIAGHVALLEAARARRATCWSSASTATPRCARLKGAGRPGRAPRTSARRRCWPWRRWTRVVVYDERHRRARSSPPSCPTCW